MAGDLVVRRARLRGRSLVSDRGRGAGGGGEIVAGDGAAPSAASDGRSASAGRDANLHSATSSASSNARSIGPLPTGDRLLLSALSRLLPRPAWRSFLEFIELRGSPAPPRPGTAHASAAGTDCSLGDPTGTAPGSFGRRAPRLPQRGGLIRPIPLLERHTAFTVSLSEVITVEQAQERWGSTVPNPKRLGDPDEYAILAAQIFSTERPSAWTGR